MSASPVLQNWKEISAYVGRTERTLQRWETEFGFPVHRPSSKMRSSVMALSEEIQEWMRKKPSLSSIRESAQPNPSKFSPSHRGEDGPENPQTATPQSAPTHCQAHRFVNNKMQENATMKLVQSSQLLQEQHKRLRADLHNLVETQRKLCEELRQVLDRTPEHTLP